MKTLLIGSIVGALILFFWGAVSWMFLPTHHHTFKHTPVQFELLELMNNKLDETGAYMLPMADNRDITMFDPEFEKENQKMHEEHLNKPMAMIFYSKEGWNEDPITFIRGIFIQFLSVLLASLIFSLAKDKLNSFFQRWWVIMLIASIVCIEGFLMGWNWMGLPWHYVKDMIFDVLIGWGLCGVWLAYYYGRQQ